MIERFRNHMTQEMLDALIDPDMLKEEILMCDGKAKEAWDLAGISMPATAASGEPVLHGARVVMDNITRYWVTRRDAAIRMLGRTRENDLWCDEHGINNIVFGKV